MRLFPILFLLISISNVCCKPLSKIHVYPQICLTTADCLGLNQVCVEAFVNSGYGHCASNANDPFIPDMEEHEKEDTYIKVDIKLKEGEGERVDSNLDTPPSRRRRESNEEYIKRTKASYHRENLILKPSDNSIKVDKYQNKIMKFTDPAPFVSKLRGKKSKLIGNSVKKRHLDLDFIVPPSLKKLSRGDLVHKLQSIRHTSDTNDFEPHEVSVTKAASSYENRKNDLTVKINVINEKLRRLLNKIRKVEMGMSDKTSYKNVDMAQPSALLPAHNERKNGVTGNSNVNSKSESQQVTREELEEIFNK